MNVIFCNIYIAIFSLPLYPSHFSRNMYFHETFLKEDLRTGTYPANLGGFATAKIYFFPCSTKVVQKIYMYQDNIKLCWRYKG